MPKPAASKGCFLWCYVSPPQKMLESKAQRGNMLGGSGAKGYHYPDSNTWIWYDPYCPHPEVSVLALSMTSLAISVEGTLPYCALKGF